MAVSGIVLRDYPNNGEYVMGNSIHLLARSAKWTDEEFAEKCKEFGERKKSEQLDKEIKKLKRDFADKLIGLTESKDAFINTFGEDYYNRAVKMLEYFAQ